MATITVTLKNREGSRSTYDVVVKDGGSSTSHVVDLDLAYYHELAGGKKTQEDLIRRSFEFLLRHEPKEAILSKFNLEKISYYYPEYEEEMG
jgi:hypothetical protein